MRFYRLTFWILTVIHLALGAWLMLTSEMARTSLGSYNLPIIYIREHGLFLFMQACAYAYVAERPHKSIPVVALATIVNACLLLFAMDAYSRGDIGIRHHIFQATTAGVMLPFLASYFVWFYHVPRPDRFMPLMGIFGERK